MTDLSPCPFCGGKAKRHDIEAREDVDNAGASYIECSKCGACTQLHFDRKENLVSSWNDRISDVAQSSQKPTVWMNHEHIDAYAEGDKPGIAWASPEKSEFYDTPLYAAPRITFTPAQTQRDLTEDQIMSVLRRTVQGELLGLLTIKGLIPSMAAECLAREFIAAFQPSPAAPVETKAKYCECFGSIPGLAATTHCPSSSSQPHCDLCGWPILPAPRSSAASESRSFYEAASREYLVEQAIGLTAALEESRQEVASLRAVPQPPSKMLTMLAILDAAGGQTEASDSKWCWLNYFCEDTDSTDTFNQAVDAKLIRVSHDSRFDSSTVYLTEAGRAAASALSRPHHSGDK